ncbi:MAG: endonuclease Q family protein [Syntrophomonas sp.]
MREVYGDLHIHIGKAGGRPVKITASRKLDLKSIIYRDAPGKGLDLVGVVDCASTLVSAEIEDMLESGELAEHPRGGFKAANGVLMIPACEVESREGIHLIIYLPNLRSIKGMQKFLRSRVKNMTLSTQKADASACEFINLSLLLEGIFCPAHAFTPHRGAYGVWTDSLARELGRDISQVKVLELGLSADADMADMIAETRNFTFLANSDAHSPANIGREYNLFRMGQLNFEELRYCIENKDGRRLIANYGMDPLLGKYHRSFCPQCSTIATEPAPVFSCPHCGGTKMIMGVYDRITAIRDYEEPHHPVGRAPYFYRVPLKELPGVGPKTMEKLRTVFRNEIELVERAGINDIKQVAGDFLAGMIYQMRVARLEINPGGGGFYGSVKKNNCQQ